MRAGDLGSWSGMWNSLYFILWCIERVGKRFAGNSSGVVARDDIIPIKYQYTL